MSPTVRLLCGLALLHTLATGLVRRGSGVVLVKISSITNPEGRDAAGACCSDGDSEREGVCPGNCYSMLKICASQVKNDSILHTLYKDKQNVPTPDRVVDRIETDETLGRNPNIPSIKPVNIPTKLVPSNDYRAPIRVKPLNDRYHKPPPVKKRRPPPLPPKKKPNFPFGSLPNPFLSRPAGKARKVVTDSEEQRLWERDEFTVMWRQSRVLLRDQSQQCRYGTIRTDVIFNNSLGGGQRDLLIKLPFEEAWPGMFELTVEIWHVANPAKIPQQAAQSKKEEDKNIFASILETLGSQLAKTVNDFESKRIKELEKEELISLKRIDIIDDEDKITNETIAESNKSETTTMISLDEEVTTVIPSEEVTEDIKPRAAVKKDKLILRLEKDHMIYAGDEWQPGSSSSYHSSIQYSVKLACSKEFTGRTCSFAKLCLQPKASNHPRLICTKEGEIVCRPGWEGARCERAVCAKGCDPSHGSCDRPGECKCRVGWHGPRCDECDLLLGCSRNGYCTKAFECVCREGWSGVFCNVPLCAPGCQGSCSTPGQCRCGPGWQGELCTECRPRQGCLHGTCSAPGDCNCLPGWRGALCDQPDCGGGCDPERGYCTTPGQCYCRVGWQGERCDQCVPYPGCLNGHCRDSWDCHCEAGWTGPKCDQIETEQFGSGLRDGRCGPEVQFVCMNGGEDLCTWAANGTLVSSPRCKCQQGYTGRYCQESLARNKHTVYTQLNTLDTSNTQKPDSAKNDDLVLEFPSKLDNSLEKL